MTGFNVLPISPMLSCATAALRFLALCVESSVDPDQMA